MPQRRCLGTGHRDMTSVGESPAPSWPTVDDGGQSRKWAIGVCALAAVFLIGGVVGYRIRASQPTVHWHTGTAWSGEFQIATEVDGWSYDIPLSVPWRDNESWRLDGRPDCLPPTGEIVPVRFAETTVKIDGASWRQVVFVDCSR